MDMGDMQKIGCRCLYQWPSRATITLETVLCLRLFGIDRDGNCSAHDWPRGVDPHQSSGPIGHRSRHVHAWRDRLPVTENRYCLPGTDRCCSGPSRGKSGRG